MGVNRFSEGIGRYFSAADLEKIRSTRVGIAGAGGLGSNCALNLVRSGFVLFTIVDFDCVEPSNLNRQFYFQDQVGLKKIEALKANLLRINPDLDINALDVRLEEENVRDIFAGCQVIVEALDGAHDKAMISRMFINGDKLLVCVSGIGGWGDSDRIRVRKIKDRFFVVGDMESEVSGTLPPTSPVVSIAAAKQADLVLSHVIGPCIKEKPLAR